MMDVAVHVKDLLSLKEFLNTGAWAAQVAYVVHEDAENGDRFSFVVQPINTVFMYDAKTEKEAADATEIFTELKIPIIIGTAERV